MIIGYGRVSKDSQNEKLQMAAFEEAGAEKIFCESGSGGRWDRPQLHKMLDHLRKDDVVVVWKMDRLSRSLKDLLLILDKITKTGASFKSLTEPIDTTSPMGKAAMQILGVFSELELSWIRERTNAGLKVAREEGRIGGRPPKLRPDQRKDIIENVTSNRKTAAQMARLYNVSRATISILLSKHRAEILHA